MEPFLILSRLLQALLLLPSQDPKDLDNITQPLSACTNSHNCCSWESEDLLENARLDDSLPWWFSSHKSINRSSWYQMLEIHENLWRISINLDEQDYYHSHNNNEKRRTMEKESKERRRRRVIKFCKFLSTHKLWKTCYSLCNCKILWIQCVVNALFTSIWK